MLDIEYFKRKRQLIELRYNPYHDPSNGRFTSGGGGGGGFLYSPNKKKGEKGMNGDGSLFYVAPEKLGGGGSAAKSGNSASDSGKIFSGEYGKISQKSINELIEMGATRWTKDDNDRLYLNDARDSLMGLEVYRYKSGNISSAYLDGEEISNSQAIRIRNAGDRTYIDLKTGEIKGWHGGDRTEDEREKLYNSLKKYIK